MNQDRKEKESVFKQSFDEVKAYFKGFRFDKPHLKAALPFFRLGGTALVSSLLGSAAFSSSLGAGLGSDGSTGFSSF